MSVDVGICGDRIVVKRVAEKILNIHRNTAHVECENKMIPAITGATGTITVTHNIPEQRTGKQEIKEL
jgi:hypothetical protein